MEEFETFFGKLSAIHESVPDEQSQEIINGLTTAAYVKFLERKVCILEDIVDTTCAIAELNCSTLSSDVNHAKSVSIGIQTDFESSYHSNVVYDSLHDVPQSFMVTDSDGAVELPKSLLSINIDGENRGTPVNPWENDFYDDVSSVDLTEFLEDLGNISHDDIIPPPSEFSDFTTPDISLFESKDITPIEFHMDDAPFNKFSIDMLLQELDFSHKFDNRSVVYFGEFDYIYTGGHHIAQRISSESYLGKLTSYLDVVFPEYEYNSALVNYYRNGDDFIPLHSDNEDSIEDDSCIITVSLGASRVLQLREISTQNIVASVKLNHGDVYALSKASQKQYAHEIIRDSSIREHRMSITFRLIKKNDVSNNGDKLSDTGNDAPESKNSPSPPLRSTSTPLYSDLDSNASGHVPFPSEPELSLEQQYFPPKHHFPVHKTRQAPYSSPPKLLGDRDIDTVYISSSMFRHLDPNHLSSTERSAKVFFYPGADSMEMIQRLLRDPEFKCLNHKSVTKVFVLTGTNYVDSIRSGLLNINSAKQGIDFICCRLWEIFSNAKLHVVNILPRADYAKNGIVNELNNYIRHVCLTHGLLYIDTESRTRLFSNGGIRKNFYFRNKFDDVHLNDDGIVRLGKHLKYFSHL